MQEDDEAVRPVLYYDELNPQARSVLMLIELLDVDVEMRHIELFLGEHLTPEYKKINPAQTVPTLVHDKLILTDSHTILIYICESFTNKFSKQLYPECLARRLKVLNRLFFEGAILFRRHSTFLTEILRKTFHKIDLAHHRKKILNTYDVMEAYLTNHKYMAGNSFTIADISIMTTVGALDLMFSIEIGQAKWPNLFNWFRRMRAMPIYKFNYEGIEKQRDIVQSMGNFEFPSTIRRRIAGASPRQSQSRIENVLNEDDSKGSISSEAIVNKARRQPAELEQDNLNKKQVSSAILDDQDELTTRRVSGTGKFRMSQQSLRQSIGPQTLIVAHANHRTSSKILGVLYNQEESTNPEGSRTTKSRVSQQPKMKDNPDKDESAILRTNRAFHANIKSVQNEYDEDEQDDNRDDQTAQDETTNPRASRTTKHRMNQQSNILNNQDDSKTGRESLILKTNTKRKSSIQDRDDSNDSNKKQIPDTQRRSSYKIQEAVRNSTTRGSRGSQKLIAEILEDHDDQDDLNMPRRSVASQMDRGRQRASTQILDEQATSRGSSRDSKILSAFLTESSSSGYRLPSKTLKKYFIEDKLTKNMINENVKIDERPESKQRGSSLLYSSDSVMLMHSTIKSAANSVRVVKSRSVKTVTPSEQELQIRAKQCWYERRRTALLNDVGAKQELLKQIKDRRATVYFPNINSETCTSIISSVKDMSSKSIIYQGKSARYPSAIYSLFEKRSSDSSSSAPSDVESCPILKVLPSRCEFNEPRKIGESLRNKRTSEEPSYDEEALFDDNVKKSIDQSEPEEPSYPCYEESEHQAEENKSLEQSEPELNSYEEQRESMHQVQADEPCFPCYDESERQYQAEEENDKSEIPSYIEERESMYQAEPEELLYIEEAESSYQTEPDAPCYTCYEESERQYEIEKEDLDEAEPKKSSQEETEEQPSPKLSFVEERKSEATPPETKEIVKPKTRKLSITKKNNGANKKTTKSPARQPKRVISQDKKPKSKITVVYPKGAKSAKKCELLFKPDEYAIHKPDECAIRQPACRPRVEPNLGRCIEPPINYYGPAEEQCGQSCACCHNYGRYPD